eukprot:3435051-Prymnesium_polylepis.1
MSDLVLESDLRRRPWIVIRKFDENRRVFDLHARAAHIEWLLRLHVKVFDDDAKVFGDAVSEQLFIMALPRASGIIQ